MKEKAAASTASVVPASELPRDRRGRLYHLGLAPGELAEIVLTCGEAARARRIARSFDAVELVRRHREFLTITGRRKGLRLSVMATGIGPDNTAIAVIEAAQVQPRATFIRLGSCGAIQEEVRLGELVITSEALRLEGVTDLYAPRSLRALPEPRVLAALKAAAAETGAPYHVGLTATTCDFYAGQGRRAPGFPLRPKGRLAQLKRSGVLNFEMEMAVYLVLASVSEYELAAGGVCAVYADRQRREFASARERALAEGRCIAVGLRAAEILGGGR
jgi:uridine phosphorylase